MRRTIVMASVVAILSTAIFAVNALGKEKAPAKKDTAEDRSAGMCGCPMYAMARPAKAGEEESKFETGAKMGMSKAMMTRCRMLMRTRIETNDPAGLLTIKDELKLTEKQVGKLQAIAEKAREEAKALLTDEQNKKLEALPKTPCNMMEMHGKMKPMMQKMSGEKGQDSPMMCPMKQVGPQPKAQEIKTPEQGSCPVSGKPIKKNIYTEYKGKKIYFCCQGCKAKFEANPQKYLGKLPQFKE